MGGGSIIWGLLSVAVAVAGVVAAAGVFAPGVFRPPVAGVTTGDGAFAAGVGPGVAEVAGVPNENPDFAAGVVVLVVDDDASLVPSFSAVDEAAAPPKLNPPADGAFESLDASVVVVAFAAPPPKENEEAGLSFPFEAVSPPPKLIPEEPLLSVAAGAAPPNENPVDAESFLSPPPLETAGAGAPPPNANPPAAKCTIAVNQSMRKQLLIIEM